MDALLVEDVSKSFRGTRAVDGLSIRLPAGSIYGFLGPNGAGKTTTIRMVMDIIRPDTGRVVLFGSLAPAQAKARIGYMPEERGLYPKMTVRKALAYIGGIKGVPQAIVTGRVREWLEQMGLSHYADKKVEELSRGMHQKVQFIATVVNDPDLLILDEPFSGLDPINTDLLKGIMLRMKAAGKTVLFSTHVMEQAEQVCDSILLINKGKKVLDGTLDAIRAQYPSDTVSVTFEGDADFVHSLPMVKQAVRTNNTLSITLRDGADAQELLRALLDRVRVLRFETKVPSLHEIFVRNVGDAPDRNL